MRVRWTRRALRALDEIAAYVAQDRPLVAGRLVGRLREAVEQLADQPASGRAGRVPGTRELVVPGTPFIVPYRARGDTVEVLTLLHGARRWPDEL